ncbi:hypothetical protein BGZ58_006114 [Dissophora ornata]|nr:hypothetical protein BGZ58_006114 [Dissophora ornata]
MAKSSLRLFCLVDGDTISRAFSVIASSGSTVDQLRDLIKAKQTVALSDVNASELMLWHVSVLITDDGQDFPILQDALNPNKPRPTSKLSSVFGKHVPEDSIHIIVQRPPPGWKQYTASDGKVVDLPPPWIDMLASTEFVPEPRTVFYHLKDDLQAGDYITMPSMGQSPKVSGRYGNHPRKLFVTEQMLELWKDIHGDQEHTEVLNRDDENESALQLVERFLALNKDILAGAELEKLFNSYNGTRDISDNALSVIFDSLLMSRDRKTLLLVDEHGKLFEKELYVPDKFRSLVPLSWFHW